MVLGLWSWAEGSCSLDIPGSSFLVYKVSPGVLRIKQDQVYNEVTQSCFSCELAENSILVPVPRPQPAAWYLTDSSGQHVD